MEHHDKPWWCYVCNITWHPWATLFKLSLTATGWYVYGWGAAVLVALATFKVRWKQ